VWLDAFLEKQMRMKQMKIQNINMSEDIRYSIFKRIEVIPNPLQLQNLSTAVESFTALEFCGLCKLLIKKHNYPLLFPYLQLDSSPGNAHHVVNVSLIRKVALLHIANHERRSKGSIPRIFNLMCCNKLLFFIPT